MSDLKCSFCLSEDDDRKYLTSDDGTACVCSNCAMMLTQYVLQERENESDESQESHEESESSDDDSGKNASNKKSKDSELNLSNLTASYQYLQQINLGLVVEDYEDLIECMSIPSILILSSDGYESNLVIAGEDQQKLFEDVYEAYDYCAKFISDLKILDLSQKKILGLITSAADEDEDGMYDTLQNEGGEVLLSQSIDIQTLREEAEDSLDNTDLFDMPFCLVQYTDSANINIEDGSLSANGSDIELSEITELSGYMDSMENKVCVYVS